MSTKTLYRGIAISLLYTLLTACSGSSEPFPVPSSDAAATSSSENTGNTTTDTGGSNTPPPSGNGVVTLSWMPPTQNTDGSALTDLSGYKIYYGSTPSNLIYSITVNNPGLASYVIENLNTNTTYYFTITAIKNNTVESSYSNIVSKHVSA